MRDLQAAKWDDQRMAEWEESLEYARRLLSEPHLNAAPLVELVRDAPTVREGAAVVFQFFAMGLHAGAWEVGRSGA